MTAHLQGLQMGDFSDDEIAICEKLLNTIDINQMPHSFGFEQENSTEQSFESLTELLEQTLADRLASLITELLKNLADADPAKVFTSNWLQKVTGKAIENSLNYLQARERIVELLQAAADTAAKLEILLIEIDKQRLQLRVETRRLRVHLAAGQLYLEREYRPVTIMEADSFDNTKERFARRLTNLAALMAANEMTIVQLDMAYTQTANLLARYYESSRVLVPIWRGHTLGLLLSGENASERIRLAQQAYKDLKNNLLLCTK